MASKHWRHVNYIEIELNNVDNGLVWLVTKLWYYLNLLNFRFVIIIYLAWVYKLNPRITVSGNNHLLLLYLLCLFFSNNDIILLQILHKITI